MRISDGFGTATVGPSTIQIANAVPTATLGAPATLVEGTAAVLTLTGVTDPASADRSAGIRFGYDFDDDGTFDVGTSTYAGAVTSRTATFPAALAADGPATHNVRYAVIDKDGGSTVYTRTVTIANVAPTAKAADVTVDEGETATIGLTNVVDVDPVRYAYDFDGDGTWDLGSTAYATAVPATTAPLPVALTANGPAVRPVRLAVVDKDGGVSEYDATVTVRNVAPTATLADATTEEGTPATVQFTNAADAGGDALSYEWDVDGDGTFEPGGPSVAVPAPDGPASLAVRGAVLDPDGGRSEYTATVTVTNAAPTAKLEAPATVPASDEVSVRVTLADVGDDTVTGVLEWGDGSSATIDRAGEQTLTHTYTGPGARTLSLVATDSDGASSAPVRHELTVAATPAAPAHHAGRRQADDRGRVGLPALPARGRPAGAARAGADDESARHAGRRRADPDQARAPAGQARGGQVPAAARRRRA